MPNTIAGYWVAVPLVALVLAAALLVMGTVGSPAARAQAVAFQADPAHTGHVTAGAPRPPLRRRWTVRLDARASYPVAADGRVFVATGAVTGPTRVIAIDARRGRVLWRRDLPGRTSAANLALAGDRLFVSSNGDAGTLALAVTDGRLLWTAPWFGIGAPPPVAANGIVVGSSGDLVAYSQVDGHPVWRSSGGGGGAGTAIAGDSLFLSLACTGPQRLRLADGSRVWLGDEPCFGPFGIPTVAGSWLLVRRGLVQVRDASSGAVVGGGWQSTYAPAVAGRLGLFANAHRPRQPLPFGHTLTARRLPGGQVRWRFRGDGYLDSSPLIARGVGYVGSGSGRLYGLDLRTGRVRWRTDVGAPIHASDEDEFVAGLAAADGLLLVPAYRRLVAYG